MAVKSSAIPTEQPSKLAASLMTSLTRFLLYELGSLATVTMPMPMSEQKKDGYAPSKEGGGTLPQ